MALHGTNLFSHEDSLVQTQNMSEHAKSADEVELENGKQSDCIEGASVLSMAKTDVQASSTSYNYDFENSTGVSTELTREDITSAANTLIDDLNNKRKQDTQLMDDFKKALELQVQRTCTMIEQRMFQVYEKQGKLVQDKLQELFACLERIAKSEAELAEFREALRLLYTDINSASE